MIHVVFLGVIPICYVSVSWAGVILFGADTPEAHWLGGVAGSFSPWKTSIIPVSKWLVTPIYKPFRPFIRGTTPLGDLLTMELENSPLTKGKNIYTPPIFGFQFSFPGGTA